MLKLGVNVDHVATVRQARYREKIHGVEPEPSPLAFAIAAQSAGAHGITAHLREDRRHMQDADVRDLKSALSLPLNLEMAATDTMLRLVLRLKPAHVCIVPERRQEVTTEGGLDAAGKIKKLKPLVTRLAKAGILTSLFIDPELAQIEAAAKLGAPVIELHTGPFSHATAAKRLREVRRLSKAAAFAHTLGIQVNAGHGLRPSNVKAIFDVPHLVELNIGHTLVSRALFVGAEIAVREMLEAMEGYEG